MPSEAFGTTLYCSPVPLIPLSPFSSSSGSSMTSSPPPANHAASTQGAWNSYYVASPPYGANYHTQSPISHPAPISAPLPVQPYTPSFVGNASAQMDPYATSTFEMPHANDTSTQPSSLVHRPKARGMRLSGQGRYSLANQHRQHRTTLARAIHDRHHDYETEEHQTNALSSSLQGGMFRGVKFLSGRPRPDPNWSSSRDAATVMPTEDPDPKYVHNRYEAAPMDDWLHASGGTFQGYETHETQREHAQNPFESGLATIGDRQSTSGVAVVRAEEQMNHAQMTRALATVSVPVHYNEKKESMNDKARSFPELNHETNRSHIPIPNFDSGSETIEDIHVGSMSSNEEGEGGNASEPPIFRLYFMPENMKTTTSSHVASHNFNVRFDARRDNAFAKRGGYYVPKAKAVVSGNFTIEAPVKIQKPRIRMPRRTQSTPGEVRKPSPSSRKQSRKDSA